MLHRSLLASVALAVCFGVCADASPDSKWNLVRLRPGDRFRLVFVTTTATPATSSLVSTYDRIVSAEASAAGLSTIYGRPVTWQALVSVAGGPTAVSRLPADDVPIYLVTGAEVASGGSALWATKKVPLKCPICETLTGEAVAGTLAWTGTNADGGAAFGGLGWAEWQVFGNFYEVKKAWVRADLARPKDRLALYGFSSVLTVPQPAVIPESRSFRAPLAGAGALLGIGVLVAVRLVRRLCPGAPVPPG